MVNQRRTEVKVGLVSLAALLILIIGISLARGCSVSVSQRTVKFRFDKSGGIQVSNPIVVNGVQRGYVNKVKNDAGTVYVEGTIDNSDDIFSDASAKISILEITGGKKIELNPGASGKKFDFDKEIPGKNSADIGDLVSFVGDLSSDAVVLVHRMDTLMAKVNEMLVDKKLAERLGNIAANADIMLSDAKSMLELNRENINVTLKNIRSIVESLKNDYKVYEPRLDTLFTNLSSTLNDAKKTIIKADTSLSSLNSILADAKNITNEIVTGRGTLSRLIYDPTLSAKMDSTITQLAILVKQIQDYGVNVNVRLGTRP